MRTSRHRAVVVKWWYTSDREKNERLRCDLRVDTPLLSSGDSTLVFGSPLRGENKGRPVLRHRASGSNVVISRLDIESMRTVVVVGSQRGFLRSVLLSLCNSCRAPCHLSFLSLFLHHLERMINLKIKIRNFLIEVFVTPYPMVASLSIFHNNGSFFFLHSKFYRVLLFFSPFCGGDEYLIF